MGDAIDMTFPASFGYARARAIAANFDTNSPNCFNVRGASGRLVSKLVTLTGTGVAVAENLFAVTSFVRVLNIVGVFEDVTNVADMDNVHLDLWDGAASVDLTLATAPDCSGVAIGSALAKMGTAGDALVLLDAVAGAMSEATKQTVLSATLLLQKAATNTYIRMLYDNADTNLNCRLRWYAEWRSFCGSPGVIAAV